MVICLKAKVRVHYSIIRKRVSKNDVYRRVARNENERQYFRTKETKILWIDRRNVLEGTFSLRISEPDHRVDGLDFLFALIKRKII